MNKSFALPALVLGAALAASAQAQLPTKIAIIHVQNAILQTKDGQKAATELQSKFAPKKAAIDKKNADIAALQDQLRKGTATLSEDAKNKLVREIDSNQKSLQRETEDAQSDLDQEQGKVMQELGNKMMAVVEKYATQNGFAVVLDVSNPQTPVLWAASAVDITPEIVKLYDQANPGTGATGATGASAPSRAPATGAAPPAAAPTRPPAGTTAPPPAPKKK